MERIETSRLNRGLKEVLAQVAAGKSFILTRYGKDVARLGPPYGAPRTTALPQESDGESGYDPEPVEAPKQSPRDELLSKIRGG